MNTLRNILTWPALHTVLCWTERIVAAACVLLSLYAAPHIGENDGLRHLSLLVVGILGLVWIAHALTLFILQKYDRAEELQANFRLYLITIALCVVLSLFETR
jgi:hypothetical protein